MQKDDASNIQGVKQEQRIKSGMFQCGNLLFPVFYSKLIKSRSTTDILMQCSRKFLQCSTATDSEEKYSESLF